MFLPRFLAHVAIPLILVLAVHAEQHIIYFVNKCGFGKPALIYDGKDILQGNSYTSNGPWSGIAYLQTGYCNLNGENCTLMEMTLINPQIAGGGSSADISLIPPHQYSVLTSFAYYNGCDGVGQVCDNPNCVGEAFFVSTDTTVQRACQTNDVNLLIAFCGNASEIVLSGEGAITSGGTFSGTLSLPSDTLVPTGTDSNGPSVTPTQLPVSASPTGAGGSAPAPTDTPSASLSSGAPSTPTTTETPTDACGVPEPTGTPTNASGSGDGGSNPTSSPTDTSGQQTEPAPPSTPPASQTPASVSGLGPSQTNPVLIPSVTASGPGVSATVPSSVSASPTASQCAPNPFSNNPSNSIPAGVSPTPSTSHRSRSNTPTKRHRRNRHNSY